MILVKDLNPNVFPQEFLDVLPHTCETCGAPTQITETLTSLECSNPRCLEKSVQRMVTMLKDIGVKDMGEAKCAKFLTYWDILNPYAIFLYEPSDGPLFEGASEDFSERIYDALQEKTHMLLWEYIKIGNLPGIRDSARKVFADYDDLDTFYQDLEVGGIKFIQEALGIKGKNEEELDELELSMFEPYDYLVPSDEDVKEIEDMGISIKALKTYNTLMQFKEDLFEAIEFVDIKKLETPVLNIVISTSVGSPFKSKQDFVNQMNSMYSHKVHLNFLSSMSNEVDFLIWSKEGAPTSKVNKAYKINEKRNADPNGKPEIPVMTGLEFQDYLEEL